MIIRVAKRPRYTVVDNRPIEDPHLSFQALGVLTFLLSKPDGWEVSYRHLSTVKATGTIPTPKGPRKLRGEGQHAVRVSLAELEAAGYLVRTKERLPDGTYRWTSYIYEVPIGDVLELAPFAPAPVDEPEEPQVTPCGDSRGVDPRGVEDRGEAKPDGSSPDHKSEVVGSAGPSEAPFGEPGTRDPGVPAGARATDPPPADPAVVADAVARARAATRRAV